MAGQTSKIIKKRIQPSAVGSIIFQTTFLCTWSNSLCTNVGLLTHTSFYKAYISGLWLAKRHFAKNLGLLFLGKCTFHWRGKKALSIK